MSIQPFQAPSPDYDQFGSTVARYQQAPRFATLADRIAWNTANQLDQVGEAALKAKVSEIEANTATLVKVSADYCIANRVSVVSKCSDQLAESKSMSDEVKAACQAALIAHMGS